MRRLYPWKPHVKKGQLQSQTYKVTQYKGTPGWILLSHNEDGQATALFVDTHDQVTPLMTIMDERICCDTVLRAIRLSPTVYVIYDVRTLNGKNLFETLHFEDRQQLVANLLETFHHNDLVSFISVDDVPDGIPVHGIEHYDHQPGTVGVFLPAEE
jgi:hypothetical protein